MDIVCTKSWAARVLAWDPGSGKALRIAVESGAFRIPDDRTWVVRFSSDDGRISSRPYTVARPGGRVEIAPEPARLVALTLALPTGVERVRSHCDLRASGLSGISRRRPVYEGLPAGHAAGLLDEAVTKRAGTELLVTEGRLTAVSLVTPRGPFFLSLRPRASDQITRLSLPELGTVEVVDPSGAPVAGAEIRLQRTARSSAWPMRSSAWNLGVTDSNGRLAAPAELLGCAGASAVLYGGTGREIARDKGPRVRIRMEEPAWTEFAMPGRQDPHSVDLAMATFALAHISAKGRLRAPRDTGRVVWVDAAGQADLLDPEQPRELRPRKPGTWNISWERGPKVEAEVDLHLDGASSYSHFVQASFLGRPAGRVAVPRLLSPAQVVLKAPGLTPMSQITRFRGDGTRLVMPRVPSRRVEARVRDADGRGIPWATVEVDLVGRAKLAAVENARASRPHYLHHLRLHADAEGNVSVDVPRGSAIRVLAWRADRGIGWREGGVEENTLDVELRTCAWIAVENSKGAANYRYLSGPPEWTRSRLQDLAGTGTSLGGKHGEQADGETGTVHIGPLVTGSIELSRVPADSSPPKRVAVRGGATVRVRLGE